MAKSSNSLSATTNSQEWVQKMVHVALFMSVGPESYMFIHKTPCDDVVAAFGGIWSAKSGFSASLFREDILDDLACRRFRVSSEALGMTGRLSKEAPIYDVYNISPLSAKFIYPLSANLGYFFTLRPASTSPFCNVINGSPLSKRSLIWPFRGPLGDH